MNTKRQIVQRRIIIISFWLFPLTIYHLSPYIAVLSGLEGVFAGCLIVFAAQLAASLFLGRAFCGWLCPVAGLTEMCGLMTTKTAKNGRARFLKYVIWGVWMGSIILLFARAGGIHAVDPMYHTESLLHGFGRAIYFGVTGIVIVLSLVFGKRAFCHSICWMAPFMVLGTKLSRALRIPSLRLRGDSARCNGCGACTKTCPMGIDVQGKLADGRMDDPECVLCARCADVCPKKALAVM
ncbi:MAG: 4Fe-4S binding protein [Clostridiales Family XIII bacterium]|nr:4Fe-4S binding protein [Clostridiales Family XIII bacterium]